MFIVIELCFAIVKESYMIVGRYEKSHRLVTFHPLSEVLLIVIYYSHPVIFYFTFLVCIRTCYE